MLPKKRSEARDVVKASTPIIAINTEVRLFDFAELKFAMQSSVPTY